jgi:hypothetical protein
MPVAVSAGIVHAATFVTEGRSGVIPPQRQNDVSTDICFSALNVGCLVPSHDRDFHHNKATKEVGTTDRFFKENDPVRLLQVNPPYNSIANNRVLLFDMMVSWPAVWQTTSE